MPLTSNQKLFERCENVFDSPAQWAVMRLIVDSEDERVGYAYPSRNKMARLLGRDRRLILDVIHELELVKEAIQRIGVDRDRGPRNRYVITLDRAIAKVRREAGVTADVPLWQLPARPAVRKSLADGRGTGIPPGESVLRGAPVENAGGEGSRDPRGGDPGIPPDLLFIFPRSSQ